MIVGNESVYIDSFIVRRRSIFKFNIWSCGQKKDRCFAVVVVVNHPACVYRAAVCMHRVLT